MTYQVGCPTPHKDAFESKLDAMGAMNSMTSRRKVPKSKVSVIRPYECVAGHWHLTGGLSITDQSRQKRRLREGGTTPIGMVRRHRERGGGNRRRMYEPMDDEEYTETYTKGI